MAFDRGRQSVRVVRRLLDGVFFPLLVGQTCIPLVGTALATEVAESPPKVSIPYSEVHEIRSEINDRQYSLPTGRTF